MRLKDAFFDDVRRGTCYSEEPQNPEKEIVRWRFFRTFV